jgi:hypothetical protein
MMKLEIDITEQELRTVLKLLGTFDVAAFLGVDEDDLEMLDRRSWIGDEDGDEDEDEDEPALPENKIELSEVVLDRKTPAGISAGRELFKAMVGEWITEDSDFSAVTKRFGTGKDAWKILQFVSSAGGLQRGIKEVLVEVSGEVLEEKGLLDQAAFIGGQMTQVSSIFFPDLSDQYEYIPINGESP